MKLLFLCATCHLLYVKADDQNLFDFVYAVTNNIYLSPGGPSAVSENDVTFYLFNQTSNTNPIVLYDNNITMLSKTKQLKVVIHGYFEYGLRELYTNIKDAYLQSNDYNVILVDWEELALKVYSESAANTRLVGKIIAGRIIKSGIDLNLVHLIGHSLGAQTAGFVGKEIISIKGQKVARITGLDPAGPLFEGSSISNRLDKSDAIEVDIIHTDSGVFGMYQNIGKVDFYPNGGTALQKGCLKSMSIPTDRDSLVEFFCSHQRSVMYFTESINSLNFIARSKCTTYLLIPLCCNVKESAIMGEHNSPNSVGIFYLETNGSPPYAKG